MMKRYLAMTAVFLMTAMVTWAQTWSTVGTSEELTNAITDGAYIRLTADITLSNHLGITEENNVTLDLNGHSLKRSLSDASDLGNVIRVSKGATLTIEDSSGDNSGMISGGRATNGGGICNHGTLTIKGGTIASNYASGAGGGVYNAPSTVGGIPAQFDMQGGIILGNWGEDGGGIYNYSGSNITISGGTISGNTSHAGGGGVVNYGIANISGGTIHNNHATTRGGGIWNGGTLTMSGGTIRGNQADIEGGGIYNQSTLQMQGDITVTGNKNNKEWDSNLFCTNGHVVTITASLGSSTIGVSHEGNDGVVTSVLSSNGSLDNFSNDFPQLATLELSADGEVRLTKRTDVIHYVERSWNGQKVVETIKTAPVSECTFLDGTDNTATYDTDSSNPYLVVRGTNTYRTINVNKDQSLILCDGACLSGNAKHAIIDIAENHQLNIYGQINDTGLLKDGAIWVPSKMTLNIHGGNIKAISAATEGAAIGGCKSYYPNGIDPDMDAGVINIYGGTIEATAPDEGERRNASAGIGGMGLADSNGSGGFISIYGGTVTARGGSGGNTTNSAAGIGGAGCGNGGTIKIYGGTVYAYGGNDAAGIGSGEEGTFSHISGGSITISGGTVYAYGNDEGAGIGAGQNADMGTVTITGGYVYAEGGENSNAIASHDDSEGLNNLTIGDQMMVSSNGQPTPIFDTTTIGVLDGRIGTIENNRAVTIQPCTHSGSTTAIVDANKHRIGCSYCLVGSEYVVHTFDNYGECSACGLVSLGDDSNNSSTIAFWGGKTKTVALSGRKLWKDDSWNTLCLPFALSSLSGTPLEGASVMTLGSAVFKNNTLTLNFEDATEIVAGKPYIVKWGTANPNYVESPIFNNVAISSADNPVETAPVVFRGIYNPLNIGADGDKTILYLSADNKLYYPNASMTIGSFRAYFQLKDLVSGELTENGVNNFVLNFGGELNKIENPQSSVYNLKSEGWFTLDGRKINGVPKSKGIYINNGNKIIIK